MATKKQQQRKYLRAKEHARRPPPEEGDEPRPERKPSKSTGRRSSGRQPQPPTWTRAARRAGIFAGGIFVISQVVPVFGKLSPAAAALQALVFFLWLVPLGYFMDGFLYRRWQKNS